MAPQVVHLLAPRVTVRINRTQRYFQWLAGVRSGFLTESFTLLVQAYGPPGVNVVA